MSTGYGWEGLRQVCATLLGARNVPECLWQCLYLGCYNKCSPLPFLPYSCQGDHLPGKPGKVGEFDSGPEKVAEIRKSREIVVCLWCATAVPMITKQKPDSC